MKFLFGTPEISGSDEEEANEEWVFIDLEASDDEGICVDWLYTINCIASVCFKIIPPLLSIRDYLRLNCANCVVSSLKCIFLI